MSNASPERSATSGGAVVMLKAVTIGIMLLAVTSLAADPGKKFESYPVMTPDADALVKIAEAMAGPGGRVVFDKASSKILVYASPEAHENIKGILKDVNVIPENILLDVVIHEAGKYSKTSASLGLNGSVTIDGSGVTQGKFQANPSIAARQGNSSTMTSQKLMLRSGGEAVISVGKEVPFLSYMMILGRNWGYIQPEVEIRNVGASLRAKAARIGHTDLVSVTLTPELSGLVGNKITRIRYTKVATTVTIRNGETLTIGSFGDNSSFYEKFLAGFNADGSAKLVNITLTVHVSEPSGQRIE